MFKLPYEEVVEILIKKANLPKEEIEERIKKKLSQLSGLISKEGAAHIVANELGIKLLEPFTGKLQIKNIMAGMRDVETAGKVMAVYEVRSFNTGTRSGKVGSFMIGDETGSVRVVLWGDQTDVMLKLNVGDIVSIISGYVRDNQGRRELHANERSKIAINPQGVVIGNVAASVSFSSAPKAAIRKPIKELSDADSQVEILGTLVQLFEPRFFEICATCNRRAKQVDGQFSCTEHGSANLGFSYVLNGVIDDGTESIRCVFFREQAAALLGMDEKGVLNFRDAPMQFEPIKSDLLGTIIKLQGRVANNAMFGRLEIVARSVDRNPDPKAELARMESS